jgi:hypothetical protein
MVAGELTIGRDPSSRARSAVRCPSLRPALRPGLDVVQQVVFAAMPTTRLSASTTGTPLIPRSERSTAKACIYLSGSAVMTFVVITSTARIAAAPSLIRARHKLPLLRGVEPNREQLLCKRLRSARHD